MIVTFTANPSLDRTAALEGSLVPGGIHRLSTGQAQAGGKGVNVGAAIHAAGRPTLAILPADPDDPLAEALRIRGVPTQMVPVGHRARTNFTITQPDGTTTSFTEPGCPVTPENVSAMISAVMASCPGSSWLALCGSLPPGIAPDWYARLAQAAREVGVRVAVDTAGAPLRGLVNALPQGTPDLLTLNVEDLAATFPERGELDPTAPSTVIPAARELCARGVGEVMVTLAELGAVLVTPDEAWYAWTDPVPVTSTVAAGDAALAGYLLAWLDGQGPADRLCRAVSYGAACVQLPGSRVPSPREAALVGAHLVVL